MPTPRKKKNSASVKGVGHKSKAALDVVKTYSVPDASKVSTLEPDDDDDIRKIFRLGFGRREGAEDHTKSSSTRKPGVYDKHLDANLRPMKVAYCPGIPAQLAEVANSRYEEHKEKFGPPYKSKDTDFDVIRPVLQADKVVRSEKGILDGYANTMGATILPIVSALAFETPSWKQRYIEWTTEQKQDKAIPDGALRINHGIFPQDDTPHDCPYRKIAEKPSGRKSLIVDDLKCCICDNPYSEKLKNAAQYFLDIVLYEIKSLKSGTLEHLTAVLEQTCHDNVFWSECDENCSHPRICPPVSGSPTGFDAENPLVRLTASDWGETEVGRSTGTPHVHHRVSAEHMIQQIWSEMVKNDATYLVLNSGNFEIIALRNRKSRTLYLSDIIVTADPGYVQVHVGLFIAAIQDVIDRAAQLNASKAANALPSSWTKYVGHRRIKVPDIVMGPIDMEEVLPNCRQLCLVPTKGADSVPYRRWNLYERCPKEKLEGSSLIIRTRASDDWNIFVGTVELSGKTFEDCVIVKTARGKYATQMLSKESSVYHSLSGNPQECKIAGMYGFFVDFSDKDEPHAILLLEHLGKPWYQYSRRLSSDQQYGRYFSYGSGAETENRESLNKTRDYMRKRSYEYGRIDEKSVVIAPGENDFKSDVFLVGLSKCVRSSADDTAEQRPAKRPRKRGASIRLGPISSPKSTATRVFKEITTWTKNINGVSVPPTARCLGWVDNLPDWLEIEASEEDVKKFEELWSRRPGYTDLRKINCMPMVGYLD
ncbi:hypothetical protein F5887DRAFT_1185480 [Amanita rubescens]|nr:hypothetical protein F5887DRAFT_1185480 [Amanita rubescens]